MSYRGSMAFYEKSNRIAQTMRDKEEEVMKVDDKGFPRYQWSAFVENGKKEQFVVREDDFELFKSARNEVLALIGEKLINQLTENKAAIDPIPQVVKPEVRELACETCGQPAIDKRGTSKAGKPYHAIFCTSDDKSHTKWL